MVTGAWQSKCLPNAFAEFPKLFDFDLFAGHLSLPALRESGGQIPRDSSGWEAALASIPTLRRTLSVGSTHPNSFQGRPSLHHCVSHPMLTSRDLHQPFRFCVTRLGNLSGLSTHWYDLVTHLHALSHIWLRGGACTILVATSMISMPLDALGLSIRVLVPSMLPFGVSAQLQVVTRFPDEFGMSMCPLVGR